MKQTLLLSIFSLLLSTSLASAQAPQQIAYQAVARNASGAVLPNQTVTLRFSLRNGSSNDTIVYQETQTATTSNIGLFNVNIGEGTVSAGTFAGIDWSNGAKFMQVELDPQGGNAFIDMGAQQMLSVPYALHAGNTSSSVSSSGNTLFIGNQAYFVPGISANNGGNNSITKHTCGTPNVHNPANTYGGCLIDQQGNVYKTIVIGTQEWMAENLKTTISQNGTAISWCYYNNDSQYDCPYGKLYDWNTVSYGSICPTGWHVPTDAEWATLTTFLGGDGVAGGKMKSTGLQYWENPNQDATNESGFSGLPGGYRSINGTFNGIGKYGYWWSSTEYLTNEAWYRNLLYSYSGVYRSYNKKGDWLSVRCLRD